MKKQHKAPKVLQINLSDTITVRDSLGLKTFVGLSKKFLSYTVAGWFPSKREDLSPEGVNKERVIDRRNNLYKEKIIDIRTGRVIRNVEETLTEHRK